MHELFISLYTFFYAPSPTDIFLVLLLAVIARFSPAGQWNYKRTKWLREREEQKWKRKKK